MTHTPGPWHYQEQSDAYTHIVRDSEERYICGCSQDSRGDAEANARLIAAVPELLDALKNAVNVAYDADLQDLNDTTSWKAIAERAIAKAEGRA